MDINKKYWAKYYKKSSKNNEFLKFHSFLDRARYYWSNKKVHYSKQKLFKNINNLNHTEFCFFCDLTIWMALFYNCSFLYLSPPAAYILTTQELKIYGF